MDKKKATPVTPHKREEDILLKYIFTKIKDSPPTDYTPHELFLFSYACLQLLLPALRHKNSFVVLKLIDKDPDEDPEIKVEYVSSQLHELFSKFCTSHDIQPLNDGTFEFHNPALLSSLETESIDLFITNQIDTVMNIFKEDKIAVYVQMKAIFRSNKVCTLVLPVKYSEQIHVSEE